MSRHQRINSDLAGLKTVISIKKGNNRGLQQFGRVNRACSTYESISALTKKQLKSAKLVKSPMKKLDLQEIINDTYRLVIHFYKERQMSYFQRCKKYLKEEWQGHKKQLNQYLNKLPYLEESMHKKTYPQIEVELISQWRTSTLLYCLRTFWYESILKISFRSLDQFLSQYDQFRDFIGQVAYLLFKGCFIALEKKGADNILDKLTDRTAHFIITSTNTWIKIYDQIIYPMFKRKMVKFPKSYKLLKKFKIESLEMKQYLVDTTEDKMMAETIDKIQKFIFEQKIYNKIQLLSSIRDTMEMEIRKHQQNLIQKGTIKKYQLLDKDDFISCLIYCVVKGQIDFQKLGVNVQYIHFILGAQAREILSRFSCDSYLTDLQAAHDYLKQWAQQYRSLNDIEIASPVTPNLKNSKKTVFSQKTKETETSLKTYDKTSSKTQKFLKKQQSSEASNSLSLTNSVSFKQNYLNSINQVEIINYNIGRSQKIINNNQVQNDEDQSSKNLHNSMKKISINQSQVENEINSFTTNKIKHSKRLFNDENSGDFFNHANQV